MSVKTVVCLGCEHFHEIKLPNNRIMGACRCVPADWTAKDFIIYIREPDKLAPEEIFGLLDNCPRRKLVGVQAEFLAPDTSSRWDEI